MKSERALITQMLEALEYVVDQGGGPLCEHEAGICFCKENTAIAAAREYLATEPKQRDEVTFGGCPACGKRSCIARSCTFPPIQSRGQAMTPPLPEHTKQANAALRDASNKSMEISKQCAAARKTEMADTSREEFEAWWKQTFQLACEYRFGAVRDGWEVWQAARKAMEADAQQATPDIKALQAKGKGPAPCARFCEANAFQIEIRRLTAEINAQQAKQAPDLKTGQHEPISHSGADEVPPIFGRRWRLARDGFGLQRDDESGNYVQINDAISTMHAILEASKEDKRVPMTGEEIAEIALDFCLQQSTRSFARAIEAHHGITPADKPIGDEPEDLYALALKADNWGQP